MSTDLLQNAYRQWRFAKQLLQSFRECLNEINPEGFRTSSKQRKIDNSFCRWLQAVQHFNRSQLDTRYPLFPRQPLNDDRSSRELARMIRGLVNTMTQDAADVLVKELLDKISDFVSQDADPGTDVSVVFEENVDNPETGGRIVVGDFQTPYSPRISYLVSKYGQLNTALVCLRYEPFTPQYTGGESGMNITTMKALCDMGHATYEGFSSPINCRLLGRPDVKFCSLFKDTDSAFGSLGNFFDINLADHPGGWILNPPFVQPVMEDTARRVVQLLDETEPGAFWFFITFPKWEDNEGWQILNESEWKVGKIDNDPGTFLQQETYGHLHRRIFSINTFVLGVLPAGADLDQLSSHMHTSGSVANKAQVLADWQEANRC